MGARHRELQHCQPLSGCWVSLFEGKPPSASQKSPLSMSLLWPDVGRLAVPPRRGLLGTKHPELCCETVPCRWTRIPCAEHPILFFLHMAGLCHHTSAWTMRSKQLHDCAPDTVQRMCTDANIVRAGATTAAVMIVKCCMQPALMPACWLR